MDKFVKRFLARLSECDKRTVLGKTLDHLQYQCSMTDLAVEALTPTLVKKNLVYVPVSPDAAWKSCLAVELFNTKNGNNDIMGFTNEEIDELFKFACTERFK